MNKVILMGRLTRDPEVRYTQTNNTLVASFSLAALWKVRGVKNCSLEGDPSAAGRRISGWSCAE